MEGSSLRRYMRSPPPSVQYNVVTRPYCEKRDKVTSSDHTSSSLLVGQALVYLVSSSISPPISSSAPLALRLGFVFDMA